MLTLCPRGPFGLFLVSLLRRPWTRLDVTYMLFMQPVLETCDRVFQQQAQ